MGTTQGLLDRAEHMLAERWGYAHLRYHQRRVVMAALTGRDCLAMLPTGGGKSICFQLPALIRGGLTVVVSPLISLMQDQVAALTQRGVAGAYLSSTQRPAIRAAVRERLHSGRLTLLYVAPERLPSLVRESRLRCGLLAVDEAHCISEWGHDFRPHYRRIGSYRQALGQPPTVAVTATATPATRADIVRVLGLRNPVRVLASFDRPNLRFDVRRCEDEHERLARALSLLRDTSGTAICYVPTRNRADGVAAWLRRKGVAALPYHGALPGPARRALLSRFLDGSVRVMAATNAFGMGIDKPDVRLVLHLGIPSRPETYYQEAGRAGRDGQPARCVLLWTKRDLVLMRRLAGEGPAAQEALEAMRRYVHRRRCRRRTLLEYLGEIGVRCSGCDRCGGAPPVRTAHP
ncbi:MAG: RecQ family ATP-dependent DNA helicase [Gemmatimonadota bacterium]|nr:RecQ family ATP-dependent DNA helicase [Gemmatimonadota bacterium]